MQEFKSARSELLAIERLLAAAKEQPYAIPADLLVSWDVGAPLPFLLSGERRAFLTFRVRDPDPGWDGTYVRVVDPSSARQEKLCVVTINGCVSAKLGDPNDEVLHGHYLSGRGQEAYTAQFVINSPWLNEVQAINGVHSAYTPERWASIKHYVFWFHDSTFECLAESVSAEVTSETIESLLLRTARWLIKR